MFFDLELMKILTQFRTAGTEMSQDTSFQMVLVTVLCKWKNHALQDDQQLQLACQQDPKTSDQQASSKRCSIQKVLCCLIKMHCNYQQQMSMKEIN
jgi:hypothetical protein